MGLFDFLRLSPPHHAGDAAVERIAQKIAANLRRLGLHVRVTRYGSFREIKASTSPKLITTPESREASGIALLLAPKYDPPQLVFEQINSLGGGLGARMAEAALSALRDERGVIARVRVNDLSPFMTDGRRWWERLASNWADLDWLITHDEDETHRGAGDTSECGADIAQTGDFLQKAATLRRLVKAFGYDPAKVSLAPPKPAFDYLGQRFTSEGESFPDGRVAVYYDPQMSDARMGCCLAHELQHVRYDAVREAWRAEQPDGPLHQRFARYTPEILAAARGVSHYSNEHWDAWKGKKPPALFSMELEIGESEPITETIADTAKAFYNWGDDVRIHPVWRELKQAIDEEYAKLVAASPRERQ